MVPLERIERANKAAKTQSIWNSDFAAMVSKTVFHQAASRRWFPLAADVQAALAMAEDLDFDPTPKERKPLSIGVAAAPLRLVQEVQPEPEQLVLTADQGDEVQP
jgi:recombinational DNA repair protein RecT